MITGTLISPVIFPQKKTLKKNKLCDFYISLKNICNFFSIFLFLYEFINNK